MYIIKNGCAARAGRKVLRGINRGKTCERQKQINENLAAEKRAYLILNNFVARHDTGKELVRGDRWITLTYKPGRKPDSLDCAHKNLTTMLRKIKRKYKACKYIAKTEDPGNGNFHHHLIMSRDVPHDFIAGLWFDFSSHIDDEEIYSLADFKLIYYFLKSDGSHKCIAAKYSASRNLDKPIVKVTIMRSGHWRREPVPKRGYEIFDTQNYFDVFGFEAQKYFMRRLI